MNILWLSLLFTALFASAIVGQEFNDENCCEEYCYMKDREKLQTRQYATKTSYDVAKAADTSVNYNISGCVQEKVWIMLRHGTRWPTLNNIKRLRELENLRDQITKNYENRNNIPTNGGLCMDDKFYIKVWKLSKNLTTDEYESQLAPQGYTDMKLIARNYKRFLPNIFNQMDEGDFDFRYTPTQRTEESYKAFAEAILQRAPQIGPQPEVDPVLSAYKGCEAWNEQNKNDKSNEESEYNKFCNSPIMKNTIRTISRRLGFKYDLTKETIESIWDMCRFEQAWHPERVSTWCAAFTPNHVTVLEYAEDLQYYYSVGYGHELNSKVACSAVQDMIRHLNNTSGQKKIAAYFTHSSNLQLLMTALGVAKDHDALRANNFEQMKHRNWKTSTLAPFASNFAAIKFSCNGGADQRVIFAINHKPIELEWCKVGLCDWKNALAIYDKYIQADCNEYYCGGNKSTNIQSSLLVLLLMPLINYFVNKF